MIKNFAQALFLAIITGAAAARAEYSVAARFPLGSNAPGYDFLEIDAASRHLFVARGDRVEVVDVDSGGKIGEVTPAGGIHGIALAPEFNRGFTSNAADRSVTMFDLKTLQPLKLIKYTGIKPDAIAYDARSKRVFVCNGSSTGDITVIDAASGSIIGTIDLGAKKLEVLTFDGRGRGFANDETSGAVHVFDTHTLKPVATWSLAPGEEPTGLAIDAKHRRLFASCGNNLLVVLDSDTGAVVSTQPIGDRPDGTAFDPSAQCVFSANGEGTLTVIHEDTPDRFTVVQNLKTEPNCRTIAIDEKTGRIFLPTAKLAPPPPPTNPPSPKPILPETFAIVVVSRP